LAQAILAQGGPRPFEHTPVASCLPLQSIAMAVALPSLPMVQALVARCPSVVEVQRSDHQILTAAVMQSLRNLYEELRLVGCREDFASTPIAISPVDSQTTGIIHVGAHRGQEAPWYYAKVGSNVAWLECNPTIIPSLQASVEPYGHRCLQACLWNRAGETRTLHLTSNDSQSASIVGNLTDEARVKWGHLALSGSEAHGSVELTTVDWNTLVQLHPWLASLALNFLVLDTQGAEYEILEGMIRSEGGRPSGLQQFRKLLVECSTRQFYHGQRLQADVTALLAFAGFACVGVVSGDGEHADVLYARKDCM